MEEKRRNKYGLSRYISSPIRRVVRKKCGFGCVICGLAIYKYHHYNPPFSEARRHDPNKIALLCGSCHTYIHGGMWSEDKIRIAHQNPKCLENGFSHGLFDFGNNNPTIVFGNSVFDDVTIIIQVFKTAILKITPPETLGSPFRLSGIFCDSNGKESFRIVENEWQGSISNWDVEQKGSRLIVRMGNHKVALRLRVNPPNEFIIEKINMYFKGASINGRMEEFEIKAPNGATVKSQEMSYSGMYCAYFISENGIAIGVSKLPRFKIGRNSPCPCISGKKYKYCCGRPI